MIFAIDDPTDGNVERTYIKDSAGYIIGAVRPLHSCWEWQSCDRDATPSWSAPDTAPTKMEAVNAAIADYVARRME